ncbi:hypothetical protein DLAC_00160 [Tieghemostelium lacteum]|uniref:Peptidase A22B family protein n=1 Tax=Tieghemostelium lacteum TaxID=361077 RepID=A0A152A904_TIELA|nr:hypothetical protein DLAC_00160 [Tieghemostelium lacteum]|eukprot:KYR02700.1 hypothetical protein DLAC_00160 [Tieghemostelium lacteum]
MNATLWLKLIFDPSTIGILLTAVGTIYYGTWRSYNFNIDNIQLMKETGQVPNIAFILFPVVGSISLLALFYFLDIMYYLLLALISFSSLLSITYVLSPLTSWIFTKLKLHDKSYKWDDDLSITRSIILSFIIGVALVISWYLTNKFVFVNILSICSIITAFTFMRFNNLQSLTILLWIFLIYDVFWVFISPYFFEKSVMETVATEVLDKFYLPLLISYDRILTDGRSALGNGDIVLPGIFLCQLYFIDKYYKYDEVERQSTSKFKNLSYFKISLIGYFFGLLLSYIIVIATQRGQPALLTLVPFSTIPPLLVAKKRGNLTVLLKPIPKPKQDEEQTNNLIKVDNNEDLQNQDGTPLEDIRVE